MDQDLFDRVFSIKLISTEILKYCGSNELKSLRKTSKLLREVVTDSEAFYTNCRVIIGRGTVKHRVIRNIPWENARVDLSFQNQGIHLCIHILENVKDLKLTVDNESNDRRVINMMQSVLRSIRVLKTLALELELFDVDLRHVFQNEQIKWILENLEQLRIFACDKDLETGVFAPTMYQRSGPISKNFRTLSKMDLCLKSFHMPNVDILGGTELLKYVPYVLTACEDTLEEVSLFNEVWTSGWMHTILCEKLKNVHIKTDNLNGIRVATFLYNNPTIQYLHIEITNGFSDRILKALSKVSSNLKTLTLTTKDLDFLLDQDDFDFLKTIQGLEDFSFTQPRSKVSKPVIFGLSFTLLINLPQHIKKLELQGIEDIWKQGQIDGYPITFDLKKQLLLPFTLVKHLSFINSPNALDDETLQFICQEFKELKTLKFSHCENVTAHGIVDINNGLDKLETLEMNHCTLLTIVELCGALKHSQLNCLDAFTLEVVNQSEMNQIALNNPNLHSISLHVTDEPGSYDFEELRKKLIIYAPQLTSVKNKVIEFINIF